MDIEKLKQMNRAIIEEFRANGGVVGGAFEGAPVLLLTTKGAKTGKRRTNPLVYGQDGNQLFIIASKAGAPKHPHWYHNIVANPIVTIEVGEETYQAKAYVAQEPERTRLFTQQARAMPQFKTYQANTERVIPVIRLERA